MKNFLILTFIILGLFSTGAFAVDYNSNYVKQSVTKTMYSRQQYTVYIEFTNTGTSSWSAADSIKLGSENPRGNTTWRSARVNMGAVTVPPGGTYRFTFKVTAPETPGTYNFQWRMLKEGVKWFGDYSPNVVINVVRPDYDAKYISQSVPTNMIVGTYYPVSITFRNMGNITWTKGGNIRLGSQAPQDNKTWGIGRVDLSSSDSISTLESKTFAFVVTPPEVLVPGTNNFQWRMLKEYVKWFGDYSAKKVINITLPVLGARFVSQDVPTVMEAGEQREVRVTFKNIGSETWDSDFALGSKNPANNCNWGKTRVYMYSDKVTTGNTKDFVFTITAPSNSGEYDFRWRLLKTDTAWFGDYSNNVKIQVTNPISVSLVTPSEEQNVSGTIPVTVNITGNAVKTEFLVDGYVYDSVTSTITGQHTFNWDTSYNHLPALGSGHTLDYTYYGVVGVWLQDGSAAMCDNPDANPTYYGSYTEYCHTDFSHHVNGYTNGFIASPAAYKPNMLTDPEADGAWQAWLAQDMATAVSNNRQIQLDLLMVNTDNGTASEQLYLDEIMDIAQPFWDHISRIEVLHEPGSGSDPYDRDQMIHDFEIVAQEIQDRSLAQKPLGVTLGVHSSYFTTDYLNIPNLDWVGVEAYITPQCSNTGLNFAELSLYNSVAVDMDRVPADKDIVLIMMAFTWNGTWTDIDALRDLQIPTYLIAQNDSRVVGINMFAYSRRDQGPLYFPDLKTPHKLIWEKISGTTLAAPDGPAGNGRRTLEIKVYDADGNREIIRTIVNVSN